MKRWLLLLPLVVVVLASCGPKCPACPTLPERPVTSAPIVTVAEPLPCELPPLPQPFEFVGFPSDDGSKIYVTISDLKQLAVYLVGMRAWITVASTCLKTRAVGVPAAEAKHEEMHR